MIVFVILLILLATLSITCVLIAFINGWVIRFSIGFAVFIFVALLLLVYMFIKQ